MSTTIIIFSLFVVPALTLTAIHLYVNSHFKDDDKPKKKEVEFEVHP